MDLNSVSNHPSLQEALEHIAFTFEGGTSLNFAEGEHAWRGGPLRHATRRKRGLVCERGLVRGHTANHTPASAPPPLPAALVIQGSACIYSKKVEYLHTLVYKALEHLAETG